MIVALRALRRGGVLFAVVLATGAVAALSGQNPPAARAISRSTAQRATSPVAAGRAAPVQQSAAAGAASADRAFLKQYCVTCHSTPQQKRGTVPLALDTLDPENVAADPEAWERVARKMRAGLMPPAGMPRAARAVHDGFIDSVESALDTAAQAAPNPGRTEPLHRLNRTEYQNAVRDLLDLEIDVTAMLPPDDSSYGFDNIAGVLKLSPTLMERYLAVSQRISRAAVGTAPPFPTVDYFRIADDLSQEDNLPGQSFGTRGGTTIHYVFPRDGFYTIRVELARDLNEQVPIYAEAQTLEVSIDGERVQLFTLPGVTLAPRTAGRRAPAAAADAGASDQADVAPAAPAPDAAASSAPAQPAAPAAQAGGGRPRPAGAQRPNRQGQEQRNRADKEWEVRVPVKAGTRDVQVAFIKDQAALPETARLPFLRPYPAGVNVAEARNGAYLRSVEISGPYDGTGPGESRSRQRIFACQPLDASEETACAERILTALSRRAYRRPVTGEDVAPLMAFYREGREEGGFDSGIERALMRLLVSPAFLYRIESDPVAAKAGAVYRIDDVTLASRLSFFLWSSIPDEELLRLAEQKRLNTPAVLQQQVDRMVADPRFSAFVEAFAGQWLFLRNLEAAVPVQSSFPDFDDRLRQAFRRETELFFESIVREGRSALDLLRADYTFLNERLARHYGIPHVRGNSFRRVALDPETHRGGLLRQGSILTVTSYPDRTSPVVRGKWILENLLGVPPPAPPPNIPDLKPSTFAGPPVSMRERIAAHRRSPSCASCHSMMDPLGLALENYDGVGRWRTLEETGATIDASGALPDGTKFEGAAGLTGALLGSDRFVTTIAEKLLTYALGRGLEYYDAPAVRAIVHGSARDEYRFTTLIRQVVQSQPFQMRRAQS